MRNINNLEMERSSGWMSIPIPPYNELTQQPQFIYGGNGKIIQLEEIPTSIETKFPTISLGPTPLGPSPYKIQITNPKHDLPDETVGWTRLVIFENNTRTFAFDTASNEKPLEKLPQTHTRLTPNQFELAWRRSMRVGDITSNCVDIATSTFINAVFDTNIPAEFLRKYDVTKMSWVHSAIARLTQIIKNDLPIGSEMTSLPDINHIKKILDSHTVIITGMEKGGIIEYQTYPEVKLNGPHAIVIAKTDSGIMVADPSACDFIDNIESLFDSITIENHPITPWHLGFYVCAGNRMTKD